MNFSSPLNFTPQVYQGGGTVGTTLGGAGSGAGVDADGVGGRREVGRGGDEIAWMLRGYRGGTVCPFFTIRGRGRLGRVSAEVVGRVAPAMVYKM